jgi:Rha family phage regulatory protein
MSKQQSLIVTPQIDQRHGELLTTSLNVAAVFGKEHKSVLRAIENLLSDLGESEDFSRLNFALSEYKDSTGRKLPMFLITESGFTLLAMGFTGKKALEFKMTYIQAFNHMKKTLLNQQNAHWLDERHAGKLVRKDLTDAVAQFVAYAKTQGSQSADLYFINVTKAVYRCLGFLEGNGKLPPNFRSLLDLNDLHGLKGAEMAAEEALLSAMDEGLPYKQVFEVARNAVEAHAKAVLPMIQKRKARRLLRGEPQ